MANERYAEKAIKLLGAYLTTQFPLEIAAIESEQSLGAGAIEDPVAYVLEEVPNDNRSPLVEIYDTGGDFEDQRNSLFVADCVVAISFASDCDTAAGKKRLQRYQTALTNTIRDNPTLTGGVTQCLLGAISAGVVRGDESTTRFALEQQIEVWIHDQ